MAGGVAAIDWTRPWFAPLRVHGEAAARAIAQGQPVAAGLNAAAGAKARPVFVPQHALPAGRAYEAHVFQTGTVPTRDNLHDFFNGLAWLAFPCAKRRLNELQAAEIARAGVAATRGALRDALTLFDENGALLEAPPALWQALQSRDWHALFVARRALWAQARLHLFGHALLEKLVAPRKAVTAHVLLAPGLRLDDAGLARRLEPAWLAGKPFAPLPVLGVPGWWAANDAPDFYADARVFRPARPGAESPAPGPG